MSKESRERIGKIAKFRQAQPIEQLEQKVKKASGRTHRPPNGYENRWWSQEEYDLQSRRNRDFFKKQSNKALKMGI